MASFHIHEDFNNDENVPPIKTKRYKFRNIGIRQKSVGVVKKMQQVPRVALHPIGQINSNNGLEQQETLKIRPTKPLEDIKKENGHVDLPKDILQISRRTFDIRPKLKSISSTDYETYEEDIRNYLIILEKKEQPSPNYMTKQMYINWDMRSILIDWLATVATEYNLNANTFHLSVNYIDRFLSNISVVKEKFQLVGAAAMMVAGKVDEIYPPDTKEWAYLTGDAFTVHQMLKMEQLMLKVLQFNVHPPTSLNFINHLCAKHNMDKRILHLAMYLSELVLLEGRDYLQYYPSELGAASVLLARYTLFHQEPWNRKLEDSVGLSLKQLSPILKKQQTTLKSSPFKEQQAIHIKYKSDKYHRVALLKPRLLCLFTNNDIE